ncbi:hypothetical protein NW813_04975 [Synechococcus sp. R55.6]|uniref:hypothetical protein n=1 Tax=Synechococcus sp. R55.4 TaxID=2964497 RepID=UPI0039C13D7A
MPTGFHLSPTGQTIRQQVAQLDEGSRRDKAWLGDAVLSLFARQWLLGPPQDWQVPSPPSCDLNRLESRRTLHLADLQPIFVGL